jgi:hypothetical protein
VLNGSRPDLLVRIGDWASILALEALAAAKIETRHWWGNYAQAHPATAGFLCDSPAATAALARSTFAVPFYCDLAIADVRKIADILPDATNQ